MSERIFRSNDKEEMLKHVLEQADGDANAFMCRGEYAACRKFLEGKHTPGQPRCQWCAKVTVTEKTTIEDLRRAIALDS